MAMIKIVSPSGWDWDRPVCVPIKISARGLIGNDRSDFLKMASHAFLDAIDNIKVAKDELPIHIIALGSHEFWGPNRNGDTFLEKTCKDRHHTFVKYARWFRNHKNRPDDGDPHYGIIKESAYNDQMHRVELLGLLFQEKSAAERYNLGNGKVADKEIEKIAKGENLPTSMACALPGTLVKLKEGYKAVENIEIGDEVLTHRGRYCQVYATLQRDKQCHVKIHTRYCGRQVLEFTSDHLFYVGRWRDVPVSDQSMAYQDCTAEQAKRFRQKNRAQLHAHARWIPCGSLQPGDLLLMPIDRGSGDSHLSRREARILGYYVAEGSLTGDGYLCFTCNKTDTLIDEIPHLSYGIGYSSHQHSQSVQAVNLTLYDKNLASQVSRHVGRGVRNKIIPRVIADAPADIKLEFLAAWFNGDGWQDTKGLHWSTCSRSLSIELQMLLASIGIAASVYRIDHTSDLPNGQPRTGTGIEYTVNASNRYSGMFADKCKAKLIDMKSEMTTVFITGDYLAVPVKKIELIESPVTVHDISVQQDESFTAYGVAVHNCRVNYDECGFCGHKATKRDDYCTAKTCKAGGCKDNLTRLIKVGNDVHHMHVRNPMATWFDMSMVFRPACRTSYAGKADYLTKMAEDMSQWGRGIGGAKLAEDMGVTAPWSVLQDDYHGLPVNRHVPAVAEQLKLAEALVAYESRPQLHLGPDVKRAFDVRVQTSVDTALLGEPGTEKCAMALAALADQKIVLGLRDFAGLVKKAELTTQAASRLPGIYTRMYRDGELEPRIANNAFPLSTKTAEYKQRQWAARNKGHLSLEKQAVDYRMRLSSVRCYTVPALITGYVKEGADAEAAEELARDYAIYKVAALHHIASFDDDFATTCRIAMSQNCVS